MTLASVEEGQTAWPADFWGAAARWLAAYQDTPADYQLNDFPAITQFRV